MNGVVRPIHVWRFRAPRNRCNNQLKRIPPIARYRIVSCISLVLVGAAIGWVAWFYGGTTFCWWCLGVFAQFALLGILSLVRRVSQTLIIGGGFGASLLLADLSICMISTKKIGEGIIALILMYVAPCFLPIAIIVGWVSTAWITRSLQQKSGRTKRSTEVADRLFPDGELSCRDIGDRRRSRFGTPGKPTPIR
jgi:hypothetical protein